MTEISDDGRFEWDSEKRKTNIQKHGIDFIKILPAFDDPHFIERFDYKHSIEEERYFGLGMIGVVLIFAISYTEDKRIRIISARLANKKEENIYDEHIKRIY